MYEATKIFVGGLSWQTTEESLKFHFEQYGPVASVEVMRDRHTGDPRGFAFVVFQDPETVNLVMEEQRNDGHTINHKLVDVKRAQARGVAPPSIHQRNESASGGGSTGDADDLRGRHTENQGGGGGVNGHRAGPSSGGGHDPHDLTPEQKGNKVFVGGIPPNVDRDELKAVFEQFGPVVDSIVMLDNVTKRSRCFGFITFENGSNGAQKAVDAQPVNVQGRDVEVKLATPKNEQRRAPPTSGPKHVGLRAGMSSGSSTGPYAGLAVVFGRSGWKAGYGSFAFGQAGWGVVGWEDFNRELPERSGFSFKMLKDEVWTLPTEQSGTGHPPPTKKAKY